MKVQHPEMTDSTVIKKFELPAKYQEYTDTDAYTLFLKDLSENKELKFAAFHFPVTAKDLLKEFPYFDTKDQYAFFWEKPETSFSIAASGILKEISANGPGRFDEIYAGLKSLDKKTAQFNACNTSECSIHFLGGFSFFDNGNHEEWKQFGASSFIMPQHLVVRCNGQTTVTVSIPLPDERSPVRIHQTLLEVLKHQEKSLSGKKTDYDINPDHPDPFVIVNNQRQKWTQTVWDAKNTIAANGLEKVVMARQLRLQKQKEQTPVKILDRLRGQYPDCTTFLIRQPGGPAFIGSSPEKLLSFKGNTVHTEALAGSMARGKNNIEDADLETKLLNSEKNNEEHRYVVRSLKQDLSAYVQNLDHDDQPVIKKLANVQHLYTPIRAQKKKKVNALSLVGHLHPTPAVGGYPRSKAAKYIRENESFNRGWFASPVGWINSKDEGEFTVAIRSGLIGDDEALLFAGCGIVADSDPDKEWQETNLKLRPMLSALNYD